ncbi:MAG: transcriptional repressor LexA [Patescibacteria group bacterium]|nr:transcriptional repressor LexA [Patescibacteria group bacterium]
METLTKKQSAILKYVLGALRNEGYSPTYEDIARHFKLRSKATVAEHLTALEAKGYLKLPGGRGGMLQPVKNVLDLARALTLPLSGMIAAGKPIEALDGGDTIAVPADLVADPINTYVLRVQGQSMIDEGIFDGDFVIVQRNPSPKNGDVVVALLDNAYATLKKFFREKDRIRLQPANPAMQPIYAKDPLIQGVVRAIIRKFQTT